MGKDVTFLIVKKYILHLFPFHVFFDEKVEKLLIFTNFSGFDWKYFKIQTRFLKIILIIQKFS